MSKTLRSGKSYPNKPQSDIDRSIDLSGIIQKFNMMDLSQTVEGEQENSVIPEEVTKWLPDFVKDRIPGVCYVTVEKPGDLTELLLENDIDRFSNLLRALDIKSSDRGENSTHVNAVYRAYIRSSIYPTDKSSEFANYNLLQDAVNEGANDTHPIDLRDDLHFVFLYDVKERSETGHATLKAIKGDVWLRLMAGEYKSSFTLSDIQKAIEFGIIRCSDIRQKLRFRQDVTGTYFEPAVQVLVFGGDQYLSMTVVSMPFVLSVLLGLNTAGDLQRMMSARKDRRNEVMKKENEVMKKENDVMNKENAVIHKEKDIQVIELKIKLMSNEVELRAEKGQLEEEVEIAKEELKKATKDLKTAKEALDNERKSLGAYPARLWVAKNEFVHSTVAKGRESTKKVYVYTGEEGIVNIGQVMRSCYVLAEEILHYLGVEYVRSRDALLDDNVPSLFNTMSMRFSLPHGEVDDPKQRVNVYIWEDVAAIKHFSNISDFQREVANYNKLDLCTLRKPDMITKNNDAYLVMYTHCGWPLSQALEKDITLTSSATLREYFVQILQQVQTLHGANLVHMDLKPSNILVRVENDALIVTLIDFEFLLEVGKRISGARGSPGFWCPELHSESGEIAVCAKMDMYSIAKTFLHAAVNAFDRKSTLEDEAISDWITDAHGGWSNWVDDDIREFLVEMLPPCLSDNPDERWDVNTALERLLER